MTSHLHVSKHPLVKHKLTRLRDTQTPPALFRRLVRDLAVLMCYEATQDVQVSPCTVQSPMGQATGVELDDTFGLVPIMRAGIGMLDGMIDLLPDVQVWHIGVYRDEETLQPVEYYNKLPDEPQITTALVLDPMLATGGSAVATVDIMKRWGVPRIKFVGLLAAPEGVEALSKAHPDVPIYVAELDERLNDIGFIVPGLGDAGDRIYGTA